MLANYGLIFFAFGRKTQIVGIFWENAEIFWWKFYRKIQIFYFNFFRIFVIQNRASEITPFFYNNFFGLGGGIFPFSPWLRPWFSRRSNFFISSFLSVRLTTFTVGCFIVDWYRIWQLSSLISLYAYFKNYGGTNNYCWNYESSNRCEVSWTAGQLDSWTHLAGFPISGIFFDNRKGCGGGSPPHINIYKIQSFPAILK